jgi:hypothetical protein
MPQISEGQAFQIVQQVYAAFGWEPDASTSRDERNEMLESAMACVHYGHASFNPAGGDPRWCIKNAGGGRPQSDDVIVRSTDRAYWDIILSAGANSWKWNLSGHSGPLPPEQQVYPPAQSSLPGADPNPGPGPDPEPEPGPDPDPPPPHNDAALIVVNQKLDQILTMLGAAEDQQAADTEQIGKWMVEQAKGVVDATTNEVVSALGPRIDATRCRLRAGASGA